MTNKLSDGLEVRCEKYLRPIPVENYLYKLNGETMEITGLKVRAHSRSVCFGAVVCAYVWVNEISNVCRRWCEVSVAFVYLYMCEYVRVCFEFQEVSGWKSNYQRVSRHRKSDVKIKHPIKLSEAAKSNNTADGPPRALQADGRKDGHSHSNVALHTSPKSEKSHCLI